MNYIINSNKYGRFGGSIGYYVKIIVNRTFYTLLIMLSFFMLMKQNSKIIDITRNTVFFMAKPQLIIIKSCNIIINRFGYTINFFSSIRRENKIIKKENLDLKIELLKLDILEDENQELKNILNFVAKNSILDYTIKKINILNRGDFINKAQITLSEDDKIKENDLVVDNEGNLVGRIVNLNNKYAEILLLTDSKSKLPAKLANSKIKVLLEGNENTNLKIGFFLGEKFNLKDGELAFTSDDGDVLQDGIPIGKIIKKKNGEFFVKINANLGSIDYVIILHNTDRHSDE